MKRKKFIQNAALGALGAGALLKSCTSGEENTGIRTSSAKKYRWKMVTTWPPNFPVLGEVCHYFAKWVSDMSEGRMEIKVYGGGELVPALECFDAVSSGSAEIGSGAAYYWAGKLPASQFFGSVPFGMNAQQMNAWMTGGDGLKLWQELYRPYGLEPMPAGNTGIQMGGWFNKRIDGTEDLKGLKMRIPGLGGKVLGQLGGTAVLSAGSEIYTNLERGVIDATEWVGPYHDYTMGFHQIAKYYYYPGWHEPGSVLEYIFNRPKFEALPSDLQEILRAAVARVNLWVLGELEAKNPIYLNKIKQESEVEVLAFPDEVIASLRKATQTVIEDLAANDQESRKVWASYSKFQSDINQWADLSERSYYGLLSKGGI